MNVKHLLVTALAAVSGTIAQAFPIAASGDGLKVFATSTNAIIATYEGNSASYSNDLYLVGFGFVFNNHANSPGDTVNLGSFAIGTELLFRLHVNNTGDDFYTGPGSRNADGFAHARVEANWAPNTSLVSFEDLFDGPFDFNDLSFSFTNTTAAPSVPDSFSTLGGLALGLAVLARIVRRHRS